MARSKIRNANAALSRGQLIRMDNSFNLKYTELPFDPDIIGACCSTGPDPGATGKCFCESGISAGACCEKNGNFIAGATCQENGGLIFCCTGSTQGTCCDECPDLPGTYGNCRETTEENCRGVDQLFTANVGCEDSGCGDCPTTGACCNPCREGFYGDGNGCSQRTEKRCLELGGTFNGLGSQCEDAGCPDDCQPDGSGACCQFFPATNEIRCSFISDPDGKNLCDGYFHENKTCDEVDCEQLSICCRCAGYSCKVTEDPNSCAVTIETEFFTETYLVNGECPGGADAIDGSCFGVNVGGLGCPECPCGDDIDIFIPVVDCSNQSDPPTPCEQALCGFQDTCTGAGDLVITITGAPGCEVESYGCCYNSLDQVFECEEAQQGLVPRSRSGTSGDVVTRDSNGKIVQPDVVNEVLLPDGFVRANSSIMARFTYTEEKQFGTPMVKDFAPAEGDFQGLRFEQNVKPFNSVGMRYNRFITSPTIGFDAFVRGHETNSLYKDLRRELDFSVSGITPDTGIKNYNGLTHDFDDSVLNNPPRVSDNLNHSFKEIKTTEPLPLIDGITTSTIIGNSRFINAIDCSKFEPNKQEFIVNLIQRNFLMFDKDGDAAETAKVSELETLTTDMPLTTAMNQLSRGRDYLQSFFHFNFGSGDLALQSGDHISSGVLSLEIQSHFGERTNFSGELTETASLFGPLRINPRYFEVVKVTKDYGLSYAKGEIDNPTQKYSDTEFWSSYYGSSDVDRNVRSIFKIDRPYKQGEKLEIDIANLLQDAIDNESGVLRFVIRPLIRSYDQFLRSIDLDTGVGNHWFEFYRDGERSPNIHVGLIPSPSSTAERRHLLSRG